MTFTKFSAALMLVLTAPLALGAFGAYASYLVAKRIYEPGLPSADELRELPLQVPLRIYTRDGKLIGEFGAERRDPLDYADFPSRMIDAFLAAEDERFFSHPGFDWRGIVRAGLNLAMTGERSQGGSTITQQLARNHFLTSERTFTRKFREILLAQKIERELNKEQILEAYLNKIFLGQRAYGVGAAARAYFGKDVHELTLSETAIIAGLPKAPSRDNPIANPERATERRNYVLRRMRQLGHISREEYDVALAEPVHAELRPASVEAEAHYVAEMVRLELLERFGDAAYTEGFNVVTTVDAQRQEAANRALRDALVAYEERRGYRGAEARVPQELAEAAAADPAGAREALLAELVGRPRTPGMTAAVVLTVQGNRTRLLTTEGETVELSGEDLGWPDLRADRRPRSGDVVRIRRAGDAWRLTQAPEVQGAFVALDPRDGAIEALVGGYDFFAGRFNRVIQARRQPGSGFKPFVYSAALSAGFTPASVLMDAPVVFADAQLEDTWRPRNFTGRFYGPTRLRDALVHSRNLVTIRLLQAVGINYTRNHVAQYGLPHERMPQNLSLALGSPVFTPLEMARAYAVLANDGFLVEPYFIREIHDSHGEVVYQSRPAVACPDCMEAAMQQAGNAVAADEDPERPLAPRVLDPRVVYLVNDMLRDVTRSGTGARARELGRGDLAGKTGTTNDEADAWFFGYMPALVAGVWVGYDQPTPMGRGEVGGRAALPVWMDFMRVALRGVPERAVQRPPGLVNVRINPENGKLAAAGASGSIFEIVQAEHVPEPDDGSVILREGESRQDTSVDDIY